MNNNGKRMASVPYFVDTNLCSAVPGNALLETKWAEFRRRAERDGLDYVVCPLVLIELLLGLVTPEPDYFQSDLRRFFFLAGHRDPEMLPFPGAFVLKTVLNVSSPVARLGPADFQQWLDVTRRASTRDDLIGGAVELYRSELLTFGLDLEVVQKQHSKARQHFVEGMLRQRKRRTPVSSRLVRARGFLRRQNIIPRSDDIPNVADALDAALAYDDFMHNFALNTAYDFASPKHRGDFVDYQLLYYLSDRATYIVTGDSGLKNRVAASRDAERIIVLSER
jgi:hypothetical protein